MSNKISIVLLTDCLADFRGGAEKQIVELARNLDRSRFRVIIASLETYGNTPVDLLKNMGCETALFQVKKIYNYQGIKEGLRFKDFLKKEKINIVVTYHFSSDIWGTFWASQAGVKIVLSNRRDMGFWRKPAHTFAYKMINPLVTKVIVVAKAVQKQFETLDKLPAEKFEVIYNGVNLDGYGLWAMGPGGKAQSPKLKAFNISDDSPVILHVANFKKVKGHTYLLQALAKIKNFFPKVKLLLIGEDELNGALQKQAWDLGISENVLFLGKRDDVRELLSLADICVLPSLSEGMSNAILEYMASGKPVVATRVGGNPELVDEGQNGLLVDPADSDQLMHALLKLLADPEFCKALGERSRRIAEEKFDHRKMVVRYEELFEKLTKNSEF